MEIALVFLGLMLTGSMAIERLLEMFKPALKQSPYFADNKKLLENTLVLLGVLLGVAFCYQAQFSLFDGLKQARVVDEDILYVVSGVLIGVGSHYTHEIKRLITVIKEQYMVE